MPFADWIRDQIEMLRAMIVPEEVDDASVGTTVADAVQESRSGNKITLRFPSSPTHLKRVRKSVEQFSSETGLDTAACDEIGLVVNEALANVIRHAYENAKDRPIELTAEKLKPGVRISIRDWGNGVNPAKVPWKEKDPMVPGGLGLICIRQLMDDMQFHPQDEGMLLVMTRTNKGSNAAAVDRQGKTE